MGAWQPSNMQDRPMHLPWFLLQYLLKSHQDSDLGRRFIPSSLLRYRNPLRHSISSHGPWCGIILLHCHLQPHHKCGLPAIYLSSQLNAAFAVLPCTTHLMAISLCHYSLSNSHKSYPTQQGNLGCRLCRGNHSQLDSIGVQQLRRGLSGFCRSYHKVNWR